MKSTPRHIIFATLLAALPMTSLANGKTGQNLINNFRYTSCTKMECVEVTAQKAWISLLSGGFTTEGASLLKIFSPWGDLRASHLGTSATFNPKLELVILEKPAGQFEMVSLKDESQGARK